MRVEREVEVPVHRGSHLILFVLAIEEQDGRIACEQTQVAEANPPHGRWNIAPVRGAIRLAMYRM